ESICLFLNSFKSFIELFTEPARSIFCYFIQRFETELIIGDFFYGIDVNKITEEKGFKKIIINETAVGASLVNQVIMYALNKNFSVKPGSILIFSLESRGRELLSGQDLYFCVLIVFVQVKNVR